MNYINDKNLITINKKTTNTQPPSLNILIGTPAFNSLVHTDYLNSIIEFNKFGIPITVMSVGNESLITRARNTIVSYFYALKQYSHLLFLDSDIHLSAVDLVKLIQHDKHIIGAPVALKGFDEHGNSVYNTGKIINDYDNLQEIDRIGTAVMLISRKVIDDLVDYATENKLYYEGNKYTRGDTNKAITMYDIFQVGIHDGEYLSEDFFFCKLAKELFSYKIYVDRSIATRHNGMYCFM